MASFLSTKWNLISIGRGNNNLHVKRFWSGKIGYSICRLITPNPLTGQLEMFGSNVKDGFLFKGFVEDGSPNGFTFKQAGQMVSYQEKFVLLNKNTMEFDVEFYSKKAQAWRKWSPGKYIIVRKS